MDVLGLEYLDGAGGNIEDPAVQCQGLIGQTLGDQTRGDQARDRRNFVTESRKDSG